MTFSPIVQRELRVAARRPVTHWTRFCVALAVLITWFLLGLGIDLALGFLARRRLLRRFREIASEPLSKGVKTQRTNPVAAFRFGRRLLNAARP